MINVSWQTILKRQTARNAIAKIGMQIVSLKELHDMATKFHGEEMIDAKEFKDLAEEYHRLHKTTDDTIKRILGSLARA